MVIGLEVVAKQRELETASALKRSMAGAAIASQAPQEWHDMFLEIGDV